MSYGKLRKQHSRVLAAQESQDTMTDTGEGLTRSMGSKDSTLYRSNEIVEKLSGVDRHIENLLSRMASLDERFSRGIEDRTLQPGDIARTTALEDSNPTAIQIIEKLTAVDRRIEDLSARLPSLDHDERVSRGNADCSRAQVDSNPQAIGIIEHLTGVDKRIEDLAARLTSVDERCSRGMHDLSQDIAVRTTALEDLIVKKFQLLEESLSAPQRAPRPPVMLM